MKHIFLLLLLIVLVLGCKYLPQPEEKIASEAADNSAVETREESRLSLNGQTTGSVKDPRPLAETLGYIIKDRTANGVFREGSNEVYNYVLVFLEPRLALGPAAGVFMAINNSGGSAIVPVKTAEAVKPTPTKTPGRPSPIVDLSKELQEGKPNPFTLIVTSGFEYEEKNLFRDFRDPQQAGPIPQFRIIDSPEDLKTARHLHDSIEIASDDSYFLNEKGPATSADPHLAKSTQRPFPADDLARVIPGISAGENKLTIIASEKASYASLLRALESAGNSVNVEVLVRKVGR